MNNDIILEISRRKAIYITFNKIKITTEKQNIAGKDQIKL